MQKVKKRSLEKWFLHKSWALVVLGLKMAIRFLC
jgi:hypothetical protein